MINAKFSAFALALSFLSAPAMATSTITDQISNPSTMWAGIDYWGVQVTQLSTVDQLLTFNITDDSKIDLFMGGSPNFKFTDVLLNGSSIASNFAVNGSSALMATGYAAAGAVSLRFKADYTCSNCWGDWFGGYVQVSKATLPAAPVLPTPGVSGAVPEPATWAMMIGGFALAGLALRRSRTIASFA